MEVDRVPVSALVEAPYNPRSMSADAMQRLRASIAEFGLVQPLVVNVRSGQMVVVGGNQRLQVLRDLGWAEVEVIKVDLEPIREKALNVALNKIDGEWDRTLLTGVLKELINSDLDIDVTGFTAEEVESLFKDFEVNVPDFAALDDMIPDEKPETKPKPKQIVVPYETDVDRERIVAVLDEHGIAYRSA